MMPYWTNAVLLLSSRAVHQFVLLRGLKQGKPPFRMYTDSGEKYCSDWVWGKFIFIIRLHSLKLSTHKDDRFLPAWRNCCIIVAYESFEALMHGHKFALCFINFCLSLGTPNTGDLQRITHLSQHLESWTPLYQDFEKNFKIRKYYVIM